MNKVKEFLKSQSKSTLYLIGALIIVVFLIILLAVGNLFPSKTAISENTPQVESQVESVQTNEEEQNLSEGAKALAAAKQANNDTVAWINISGTDINAQVMQSVDNEYYLNHNEAQQADEWGSYFADYYANLTGADKLIQNTVIYGHTGFSEDVNGQRFSQLFRFADLDFLKQNQTITLTVDETDLTFQIFAVFYTDTDFYYIDPLPSDQGFDAFLQEVQSRNEYIISGLDVNETDKLLTLSGCSNKYDTNSAGNQRFVVMAKLVNEPIETTIEANPQPKRPQ